MDSNFESGGTVSGGSSMPDLGNSSEIFPGEEFEQPQANISGSGMNSMDYLKDGVDKGYYKQETEGIFSLEEVMSDAQSEMSKEEENKKWDIMQIPGTSHEKLSKLAEMSDEDIDLLEKREASESKINAEDSEEKEVNGQKVENLENKENQPSFEEQIIKLQAETMKLMAEGMNSKVKDKDLEELIKKLQKLLEEAEKEEGNRKATLLSGVFFAISLLLKMGEESYKKLENEVKEVEK